MTMSQMSQICHKCVTNWWKRKIWYIDLENAPKSYLQWFWSPWWCFRVARHGVTNFVIRLWHVCDSLWQICDKCVTKINIGGSVLWIMFQECFWWIGEVPVLMFAMLDNVLGTRGNNYHKLCDTVTQFMIHKLLQYAQNQWGPYSSFH